MRIMTNAGPWALNIEVKSTYSFRYAEMKRENCGSTPFIQKTLWMILSITELFQVFEQAGLDQVFH